MEEYLIIRGLNCSVCGGGLSLVGLIGHTTACVDCGLLYQTEILSRKLGHTINFKKDIEHKDIPVAILRG